MIYNQKTMKKHIYLLLFLAINHSLFAYAETTLSSEVIDSVYDDTNTMNSANTPKRIQRSLPSSEEVKSRDQNTINHQSQLNSENSVIRNKVKKQVSNKNENSPQKKQKSDFLGSAKLDSTLIRKNQVVEIKNPIQIPKNSDYQKNIKLARGLKLKALINSDIIAYTNSKSPIEAYVLDGEFKGSELIGNATMDVQTKRVNIEFTHLKKKSSLESYSLSGLVRDQNGELGLDATHESFYWNYFMAETILNTASGMANASTERSKTMFGDYEVKPSADSIVKQGVSSGLSRSADRIGEQIRNAPEYVKAKGPFVVSVIIID